AAVRAQAAEALGKIADNSVVRHLNAASKNDPHSSVRNVAMDAIRSLGSRKSNVRR
ncbi:HEAT repeat-containing protein, partial [Candidatus Methanophagaceae archaeon]